MSETNSYNKTNEMH